MVSLEVNVAKALRLAYLVQPQFAVQLRKIFLGTSVKFTICKYRFIACLLLIFGFLVAGSLNGELDAQDSGFQLNHGERIAIIGNTLADRMQHFGWLETYIQALHPDLELSLSQSGIRR